MVKILGILEEIEKEDNISIDETIRDYLHEEYFDVKCNDSREFKKDVRLHLDILLKQENLKKESKGKSL